MASLTGRIVRAALADNEIGSLVVSLVREAAPGDAKHAVLTQGQQKWLWNAASKKYQKQLSQESMNYYTSLDKSEALVLKEKALFVEVLGGRLPTPSSSTGPAPKKRSIQQRVPKAKLRRKRPMKKKELRLGKYKSAKASLAKSISKLCRGDRGKVHSLIKGAVCKLDESLPGLKQELLKEEPQVDNQLLKTLSTLKDEAINNGFTSICIQDLDFAMSNHGLWSREFLQREGYPISKRSWKRIRERAADPNPPTRKEREAKSKGGRPKKSTPAFLAKTKGILLQHSKPGSKVARVHLNSDGTYGPSHGRGSREQEVAVPSQSMLLKPAQLWKQNAEIREHVSKPTFNMILKAHFADFRQGQRATDVCGHCQCFWDHIAPRFHRDWNKIQADLKAVYPRYFDHFPQQDYRDVGEEAEAALKYVSNHADRFKDERIQSRCDRLRLFSMTEAPAQVLLKGHCALIRSYLWHMLSARRQKEKLLELMDGALPAKDTLLVFDWKEKIRLPMGPHETSEMWHAQQKYAISCFGCCVFQHRGGKFQHLGRKNEI